MTYHPLLGQGLLVIDVSRSRSDTHTAIKPTQTPLPAQFKTLTRDRHPCSRRDSNPQSRRTSGRRPTPQTARPLGSACRHR